MFATAACTVMASWGKQVFKPYSRNCIAVAKQHVKSLALRLQGETIVLLSENSIETTFLVTKGSHFTFHGLDLFFSFLRFASSPPKKMHWIPTISRCGLYLSNMHYRELFILLPRKKGIDDFVKEINNTQNTIKMSVLLRHFCVRVQSCGLKFSSICTAKCAAEFDHWYFKRYHLCGTIEFHFLTDNLRVIYL